MGWAIIGFLAFAFIVMFLWGMLAGGRREDDYEDQMRAIAEWKAKKE